jgi:hypothetical protein
VADLTTRQNARAKQAWHPTGVHVFIDLDDQRAALRDELPHCYTGRA